MLSPVYTGILIQILIQIKLDSNPDSDHLSHVDCDPDSNPDSGPGVCVNAALGARLTCIEKPQLQNLWDWHSSIHAVANIHLPESLQS